MASFCTCWSSWCACCSDSCICLHHLQRRSDNSGTAINFLAPGIAIFICRVLFADSTDTPAITDDASRLPKLLDGVFPSGSFWNNVLNIHVAGYICFICVAIVWFLFYKTKFGLRLRAVGEHPQACDTLGINVTKTRYIAVILSGFFSGLGGAYITMATTNQFKPAVIVGQGFMAISAVIFGKFTPHGAMLACMLFGLCSGVKVLAGTSNVISRTYLHDSYIVTIWHLYCLSEGKEFQGKRKSHISNLKNMYMNIDAEVLIKEAIEG